MKTLKGWLSEAKSYRGIPNVRQLFFKCPTTNPALKPHNDVINVHLGVPCTIEGFHIWHYEIREGKCVVTPSIDASKTPCGYHDFYDFDLVSEEEIGEL